MFKELLLVSVLVINLVMILKAEGNSGFDFGKQIWNQIQDEMMNDSQTLLNVDGTYNDNLVRVFCNQQDLSTADKILCGSLDN